MSKVQYVDDFPFHAIIAEKARELAQALHEPGVSGHQKGLVHGWCADHHIAISAPPVAKMIEELVIQVGTKFGFQIKDPGLEARDN